MSDKHTASAKLGPDGQFYLDNVIAEYHALAETKSAAMSDAARAAADGLVAKSPNLTWSDVFALELLVARMQPLERLRQRLCIVREKYRDMVGDDKYKIGRAHV